MTLRLFVDSPLTTDCQLELPPAAARHVMVRRLQPGDGLRVFNGTGGEWSARIVHIGRSTVTLHIGSHDALSRELPLPLTLAVAVPANERMDLLVEKATELGVHIIQPLLCERSVVRLAADRAARRREHWQAVAAAASEQCGRTRLPTITPVLRLERWLDSLTGDGARWLLSLREAAPALHTLRIPGEGVCTLSGPEGGLTPAEEALACDHGFTPVGLGPRVLRAETAAIAVSAWIALQAR